MEKGYKEKKAPWLAITLCCGEKREVDGDERREVSKANGESEMQICYEQPTPVPYPIASPTTRPMTSHSVSQTLSQFAAQSRDFATRASSRASVHTLARPRKSHSRARPSIGQPMDFRHNDGVDGIQTMLDDAPMPVRRRRSFQPLELSIYLADGRLSPLPDFEDDDWVKKPAQALVRNRASGTDSITSISAASAWLIERKPVGSGSRRSSLQSMNSGHSRTLSGTISSLPFLLEEPKSLSGSMASSPTLVQLSSTTSLSQRKVLARLPSPSRSRANTAPSSGAASIRKFKTDSDPDVDAAIRELNTIVEERRASAYRSANLAHALQRVPPSPSHVPAIAPSLRMKVRSETLSDIGSAFSIPLTSKPLPTPPAKPKSVLRIEPVKRTFSGPLDSNPITPPTPTMPTPTSMYRLKGWLKRSLPTTPSSPSTFKTAPATPSSKSIKSFRSSKSQTPSAPFYQCQRPPSHHRDFSQQYFDMEPSSRPSSSSSRSMTVTHTRQASNETATVTLVSSCPSTPSLLSSSSSISHRSMSPISESDCTPATPARVNILKGNGKMRKIPPPLSLTKAKEMQIEASLGSAKSFASTSSRASRANRGSLKPPPSPNYGILRGMEISAREEGVLRGEAERVLPSPGAVGVAF
ncbi:hypothetical protein P280DRAFT_41374 [Massarina eburnea CBS 473.64]|uniref:Uncharacterized protein n=1 Tax=Massarina eburnea CBS 473.64 TaxID=1395130 RepID=A0A6A6RZH6_9PLEO|nr:hypothetical protein P280DRAFT_41374 [Massarina eburnea CBS 473.64]